MSDEHKPYAIIRDWAIVRLTDVDRTTNHVVGYILRHESLESTGEPYIGTPLRSYDLENRVAINAAGKSIQLHGAGLSKGDDEVFPSDYSNLPPLIQPILRRAWSEWRLSYGASFERVA